MSTQSPNPSQLQAIQHRDGPLLVIAGPGSGKTKTLVDRIVHLIQSGVQVESIMVSTFTEKAAKELLINPENYFNKIYKKYVAKDSLKFTDPERNPCYHSNPKCERLNSDFQTFEIPEEIREKGLEKVNEFREWFKTVQHFIESKPDVFAERLRSKYGIITNPQAINLKNGGYIAIENYNVSDIENQIDTLLSDSAKFYFSSTKNTMILKKLSRDSYLGYSPNNLLKNDTGYSDEEVKVLLREYNEKFKRPLKRLLIIYYRLKHNPNIQIDASYLDQLGFIKCRHCSELEDNCISFNKSQNTDNNDHFICNISNNSDYDDNISFNNSKISSIYLNPASTVDDFSYNEQDLNDLPF